jgi:hypothetical protein
MRKTLWCFCGAIFGVILLWCSPHLGEASGDDVIAALVIVGVLALFVHGSIEQTVQMEGLWPQVTESEHRKVRRFIVVLVAVVLGTVWLGNSETLLPW